MLMLMLMLMLISSCEPGLTPPEEFSLPISSPVWKQHFETFLRQGIRILEVLLKKATKQSLLINEY